MSRRLEIGAVLVAIVALTGCGAASSSDGGTTTHTDAHHDTATATDSGGTDGPSTPTNDANPTTGNDAGTTVTSDGGGVSTCFPNISCASMGYSCGQIPDGCGGLVDCGTCPASQVCGASGMPGMCGMPTSSCQPGGCGSANCGQVGDGCGGLTASCGTCTSPAICGGAGTASVCGSSTVMTTGPCTGGLCNQIMACSGGATTTISGTVYAPTPPQYGPPDPLYNALVYVPNAPVEPFGATVSCDICGAAVSGSPIVTAVTGPDGTFRLSNVPSGANIPLVIQLGHWRRQITIPNVNPCTNNALTADQTRLPRNHTEGDIPEIAISTGTIDAIECVLRKIGIDDSEFTSGGGTGRVQMYIGNGGNSSTGDAPMESSLVGSATTLASNDMVLFACQAEPIDQASADQQRVIDYANAGGRIFATHYSYVWLYNDTPFSSTAQWDADQCLFEDSLTATIDQSFPRGIAFAQWLQIVGASTTAGQVTINQPRHDFDGVNAPSQRWLYSTNPAMPLHYTFNTPVGAAESQQCGRVLFSDFHVNDSSTAPCENFPSYCDSMPMTPQERVLEFMIFDLSSCVPTTTVTVPQPMCNMTTCAALGAMCGMQADGCGGTLDCGTCTAPETCGGGGTPNQCGQPPCVPNTTCQQAGVMCGSIDDGCSVVDCGSCTLPDTCGGAGVPNQCGNLG